MSQRHVKDRFISLTLVLDRSAFRALQARADRNKRSWQEEIRARLPRQVREGEAAGDAAPKQRMAAEAALQILTEWKGPAQVKGTFIRGVQKKAECSPNTARAALEWLVEKEAIQYERLPGWRKALLVVRGERFSLCKEELLDLPDDPPES